MNISLNFSSAPCYGCGSSRSTGSGLMGLPPMPRAGLMSPLGSDFETFLRCCDYAVRRFPGFGMNPDQAGISGWQPNGWSCALTGANWDGGGASLPPTVPASPPTRPAATQGSSTAQASGAKRKRVNLKPLAQSNSVSCGQTSVAMSINALTGKKLTDRDIQKRYGFSLLQALNAESRGSGYSWKDGGNLTRNSWGVLEQKINKKGTPVLIGLNGPNFSPSGRGHIVTLIGIDGDKVTYADPADGKVKTTTRRTIEQAPPHPDGKFLFYVS